MNGARRRIVYAQMVLHESAFRNAIIRRLKMRSGTHFHGCVKMYSTPHFHGVKGALMARFLYPNFGVKAVFDLKPGPRNPEIPKGWAPVSGRKPFSLRSLAKTVFRSHRFQVENHFHFSGSVSGRNPFSLKEVKTVFEGHQKG